MTAKKWIISFAATIVVLYVILAAANLTFDPFGVFGDKLLDWYSYDMTLNPRAAKIAYLDKNYEKYDSYIVGCSSTSSYPTEDLNKAYDASFYNMIMYGADMLDVENECRYIIENYNCKNMIVNIYIDNACHYDEEEEPLKYSMDPDTDGSNIFGRAQYYLRYLSAKPNYIIDKLRSKKNDTYLNQSFDVFNVETGAYDKRKRDIENVSNLNDYLASYPEFVSYAQTSPEMTEIESTAKSLQRICDMCEEADVNLTVVSAPVYWEYFDDFQEEEYREYYKAIAEVTDFWDFSISSISFDPRYFYDATHFRNSVGSMAVAKMTQESEKSLYMPSDFGNLVTSENVDSVVDKIYKTYDKYSTAYSEYIKAYANGSADSASTGGSSSSTASKSTKKSNNNSLIKSISTDVPVLLYHHIEPGADGSNGSIISLERFEEHMKALKENGYNAITCSDLISYAENGTKLPNKPILITFDDGYQSNYEYAYPILKKYGLKGTIFVIGSFFGSDTYKDTDMKIIPHFGMSEAQEMVDSGVIEIQSHTYDMHQSKDGEAIRAEEKSGGDKASAGVAGKSGGDKASVGAAGESGGDKASAGAAGESGGGKASAGAVRENIMLFDGESEWDYADLLEDDVSEENELINKITGEDACALAYPCGRYCELTAAVLRECGIKMTFTTEGGINTVVKGLPQSLMQMKRFIMFENVDADYMLKLISGQKK